MDSFGVIVVGVGRAGGARIRDIGNAALYATVFPILQGVKLVGFVSRRADVKIEGSENLVLEEALARPDVHCAIIATENSTHESLARQCLNAGKHVLVDFPLSINAEAVKSLTSLAKEKGVKCAEEDIGLLTADYKTLQEYAKSREVESGFITLGGSMNGWIGDWKKSGSPFHCSSNCMHTLLDICGDITPVSAHAEYVADTKCNAYATFKTQQGKLVELSILREVRDKPYRKKEFEFKFTDGSTFEPPNSPYTPPTPPDKPGLFMKDFIQFVEHVKEGVERVPSDWVTFRAVQLADEVDIMMKKSPKSTGLDF